MTISTTSAAVVAQGNNSLTVFNFPFVADQASDLSVYYTNTAGVTVALFPYQYTVYLNPVPTGGLWSIGGTITFPLSGSPIAVGESLTIIRSVPDTQQVSVSNQGAFYATSVEQGMDILELQIQQLAYGLSLTLQVPIGVQLTPLQYIQQLITAYAGTGTLNPQSGNISTVSASTYTVQPTDFTLLFNAAGGAQTVILPNPLTYFGRIINLKKVDSTTNLVTFTGNVDGSSTYSLAFMNQSVTLQSNGTSWSVL